MEIPLPAWLGALAGTTIGVIAYVAAIGAIDRRLRAVNAVKAPQDGGEFERRLAVLRRIILAIDIGICAALGYWLGGAWGGAADLRIPL
jgi:hypothetical protein